MNKLMKVEIKEYLLPYAFTNAPQGRQEIMLCNFFNTTACSVAFASVLAIAFPTLILA